MKKLKNVLFVLMIFVSLNNVLFAQVSDCNHPPMILGQHEVTLYKTKFVNLSPEQLIINDLDGLENVKFEIEIQEGEGYKIGPNNQIEILDSKLKAVKVPVRVSDGFASSEIYEMIINKEDSMTTPTAIYVSSKGNDKNKGSLDSPLKTIEGARNYVRKLKEGGKLNRNGAIVYFREGEYFMNNATLFEKEDSGDLGAYIRYKAYNGESVRFIGAKKIDFNWFEKAPKKVTGLILEREARNKIKMLDLKKYGLMQYGIIDHVGYVVNNKPLPSAMVYIDGESLHLSRYPNIDNFDDIEMPVEKNRFVSKSKRVCLWKNKEDIWIDGAVSKPWEWKKNKIKEIDENGTVTMTWDYHDKIAIQKPKMFYFNIIEELDYPGEFYIDRKNAKMYIYLPDTVNVKSDIRITQSENQLIRLKGAQYITFEDICFEGTRNTAIELIENAKNIIIKDCEIHSCGLDGIIVNGENNKIENCHIHHVGANGVVLLGGDEETLKPARNIIENCKIHDFSQERRVYNPGIALRGVGHVVRSTEIYNGPHMGMIISGNNHLIEYSDFHNCPQEYSDMLAVYMNTGNYPLMRGTVIRRNEFHDVQGSWKQSAGVYLDNETSGVLIEGNYFYRNGAQENGWSVMIHGGADNVVRSKLFVDCSYPFCISLRLNGYAADNFEGLLQRWEKALKEAPKVYYRFYPELNHYFDDEEERPEVKDFTYHLKKDKEGRIVNYWNRRTPSTNVWKDNIIYNNQSVPFCMPVTDKRKNVENRGFYTTGLFRIKNGVRQDNLIHSGNKVLTPEYKKEVSEY